MKKALHRFGKYYSKIIVNDIGIFIFVGILFVVFGDCGWFPNRNIYAISQFVYKVVIPIMIAYEGGNQIAKTAGKTADRNLQMGGAIAVMATSGMILASEQVGILAAMILGPVCGMLWQTIYKLISEKVKTGLEMLIRNLTAAVAGCIMAVVSFYFLAPMLSVFTDILMEIVNYIIEHKLIWLSSLIIEPSKVFFCWRQILVRA